MSYVNPPAKHAFVSGAALSTLSFEIDHIPLEDDRLAEDAPESPAASADVDAMADTQRVPG